MEGNFQTWGQILERFTGDLILRGTFEIQTLPNSKKLWISIQRTLLDIHFMMLLEEVAHPKFFGIR